jgi:hypothetical protein
VLLLCLRGVAAAHAARSITCCAAQLLTSQERIVITVQVQRFIVLKGTAACTAAVAATAQCLVRLALGAVMTNQALELPHATSLKASHLTLL